MEHCACLVSEALFSSASGDLGCGCSFSLPCSSRTFSPIYTFVTISMFCLFVCFHFLALLLLQSEFWAPHKFTCWSLSPRYFKIWLWSEIRPLKKCLKWSLKQSDWRKGNLNTLRGTWCVSARRKGYMRKQQEDGHMQAKRGLRKTKHADTLILDF